MSEAPFRILCVAASEQAPVMIAAGRRFVAAIEAALDRAWPSRLALAGPGTNLEDADLLLLSLDAHVASAMPIAEVAAQWDRVLATHRLPRVVMPTVYRYVADPTRRAALGERCRRINMAVVDLSRTHGIEVADVDRAFSLIGAEAVGSDYRCQGDTAAGLAGHVLAEAMLGCDLAPQIGAEVQHRALATLAKAARNAPETGE